MHVNSFFSQPLAAASTSNDHAHHFWEFVYAHGSGGWLTIDGKRMPYTAGAVIVHPPEQMHICFNERPAVHYCLGMNGKELKGLSFAILPQSERIAHAFRALAAALTDRTRYQRMIMDAIAAEIVWSAYSMIDAQPDTPASDGIEAVKEFLDLRHHEHGISLDTLSAQMVLSKDALRHLFRERYGISPIRYLIGKKIDHAKALLSGSDKRIHEIAAETGFENEYYFSRAFKKMTGVTPTAFRTALGQNRGHSKPY